MFGQLSVVLGEAESEAQVLARVRRFARTGGQVHVRDDARPLDEMRRLFGMTTPVRVDRSAVVSALQAAGHAPSGPS